jgi:SAM-dependent methyltransferase
MVQEADSIYSKKSGTKGRVIRWFHNSRLQDFSSMISENNGVALSVGCGSAHMERHLLSYFDTLYGIDPLPSRVSDAKNAGLEAMVGSVPPIPFSDNSLDTIIAAGTTEHIADERGFYKDATRVLRTDGKIYVTIPIEVGIGGLLRYWGRCVTYPNFDDSPSNWARFMDFSKEELLKRTPREKHGTLHRYYNYKYALSDLRGFFTEVEIKGWPVPFMKSLNLILFAKAVNK